MPLFLQPFAKYADFNGRARRAEYWQWIAFQFAVGFVLGILKIAVGAGPIAVLQMVFGLATIVPSIAVSVRRFHDTNRTGWWYLFPTAVACVMIFVVIAMSGEGVVRQMQSLEHGAGGANAAYDFGRTVVPMLTLFIVPTLIAGLVTFIFLVLPGTDGPNRFGDDPKGNGTHIARVFDAPERVARETYDDEGEAYKPVFDFGPSSKSQMRETPVAEAAPAPVRMVPQASTPAKLVFGKRRA